MLRFTAPLIFVALIAGGHAQTRMPWTSSRVAGTPEPPRMFVSERVLPEAKFTEALKLARVPGEGRFMGVERRGRVYSFAARGDGQLDEIINLRTVHPGLDNAFSVVLHPRFRETREIFVAYALAAGQPEGSRVSRFKLSALEPLRVDPASEEIVVSWLSGGHNGCSLQFGPDRMLYISTGDAGPAAPPDLHNTGQDVSDLAGGILRIDVTRREPGKNYAVPADNPWVGKDGVRPELWAYGLRNPWRMSFDPENGNLWCGDIGWELWEMVHLIKRGANYGWSAFEAAQPIKPHLLNPLAPVTPPVIAHPHAEAASITGGVVYRGKQYPELVGAYVYGDYATGKIWALWHDGVQMTRHMEIADTPHAIIAFAADEDGEVLYLHYANAGSLHRLVRNPEAARAGDFPRRLSETGVFADVARQVPAAGVYPFAVTAPLWSDGAEARRWIALPGEAGLTTTARRRRDRSRVATRMEYATSWPAGAVLLRTLSLGALAASEAERGKPIETQMLHYDGEAWNAYTYRWNDEATEAELVPAAGAERTIRAAADPQALGPRTRDYTWRFASRAECLRCHNSWHNGALGFTALQMHGVGNEQIRTLATARIVDDTFVAQTRELAERPASDLHPARAWLHANCAACHTQHAGGSAAILLGGETALEAMNLVGQAPTQGGLGLREPKIVTPGEPEKSVLAVRIAKMGSGHMPPIGAREVDVAGVRVIEEWIAGMGAASAAGAREVWDRARIERELATVEGAMRLRKAVDDGLLDAGAREIAFRSAWQSPESTVRDLFERFKPDELRERTLGVNVDAAELLGLRGDGARGAALLSTDGKLGSCLACHVIRGHGRHVGPELSKIGAQQTPAQILESIIAPSKVVAPLYRTTVVTRRDGTVHVGFVRARGAAELVLSGVAGETTRIPLAEIEREEAQLASLMPEGLWQGMTAQEAADVVAYLAGLK